MQDLHWKMPANSAKAIMLAKHQLAELVCDAVNLEGIAFTLPEVQTLLQGVTVGGHKLSDQQIVLNQACAWDTLFQWLKQAHFVVSAQRACELHAIAAKEEALTWGVFRSGGVLISGTDYTPPKATQLPGLFQEMLDEMALIADVYDAAIFVFLSMARQQFFYDVNKRMGRFMMNGLLLSKGYPAINVPAKRQLEFNQSMLDFYDNNQQDVMNRFLRSCLEDKVLDIMCED